MLSLQGTLLLNQNFQESLHAIASMICIRNPLHIGATLVSAWPTPFPLPPLAFIVCCACLLYVDVSCSRGTAAP